MPNWKNEAEYSKFSPEFSLKGWAWEFMRRNPKYQRDYETATHGPQRNAVISASGIQQAGTISHTFAKTAESYGASWGQRGPIANFASDKVPDFLTFPIETDAESIRAFFELAESRNTVVQHPYFATITFDLRGPFDPQVRSARRILRARKKLGKEKGMQVQKPKHPAPSQWKVYLRVLDAMDDGATSKEMVKELGYDKKFTSAQAHADSPSKRLSAHRKAAGLLRADPLSILR